MDVALRPLSAQDLPLVFDWHRDPESAALAGVPARDRPAFDAHWARLLADPDTVLRVILADGAPAGYALSWRAEGRRWVGYWIARERWGQGIASRALPLVLRDLPERPLYAIVRKANAASIRVLERAGFARAGEDPRDAWIYALS